MCVCMCIHQINKSNDKYCFWIFNTFTSLYMFLVCNIFFIFLLLEITFETFKILISAYTIHNIIFRRHTKSLGSFCIFIFACFHYNCKSSTTTQSGYKEQSLCEAIPSSSAIHYRTRLFISFRFPCAMSKCFDRHR